jgi:hypothetical protein
MKDFISTNTLIGSTSPKLTMKGQKEKNLNLILSILLNFKFFRRKLRFICRKISVSGLWSFSPSLIDFYS